MKAILSLFAALLIASPAAFADALKAKADGNAGVFMSATLAPFGSFEFLAAPSYTSLATVRRNAAVALRKGTITRKQAIAIQVKADHVRSLLDQALAACAQDDHTGWCTKSASAANALLNEAQAALAALK